MTAISPAWFSVFSAAFVNSTFIFCLCEPEVSFRLSLRSLPSHPDPTPVVWQECEVRSCVGSGRFITVIRQRSFSPSLPTMTCLLLSFRMSLVSDGACWPVISPGPRGKSASWWPERRSQGKGKQRGWMQGRATEPCLESRCLFFWKQLAARSLERTLSPTQLGPELELTLCNWECFKACSGQGWPV